MSDDLKTKMATAGALAIWTTLAITTFWWGWLVAAFTAVVLAFLIIGEA